jgi:hypothetical protein
LGVQPGTSQDIDFYSTPMAANKPYYQPKNGWKVASEGNSPPPTTISMWSKCIDTVDKVLVVRPLSAAYEAILFSEEHSYIKFVCPNGQVIPAHQ